MNDIDTTLTNHLRVRADQAHPIPDIDAVVHGHIRIAPPTSKSTQPGRRGLLAAAAAVVLVGVGGLFWAQSTRNEPATSNQPATAPAVRQSGSIGDPKAIDFSPWVAQAPPWPTGQPTQYLIFDVAALDGWTQLDQTGGHPIDEGASYYWSSNVNGPEGTQFNLTISNSDRYSQVEAGGDIIDINGVDGNLGEGEVSWPLNDAHTATVVEFGTTDTDRVVALARELTLTMASSTSSRQPATATDIPVKGSNGGFAGTVDGVQWSASETPEGVQYIVENTMEQTYEDSSSGSNIEIREVGNNDICVFLTGTIPNSESTVQLVLSDSTTATLPTQPLAGGQWFTVCLPYALDAVAVEIDAPDGGVQFRHELHGPYFRPTIGAISS